MMPGAADGPDAPVFAASGLEHAAVLGAAALGTGIGYIAGNYDAQDERSLLWAVDLGDPPIFGDGFESGGTSAWALDPPH